MKLEILLGLTIEGKLAMESAQVGKEYEIIDFYQHQPKIKHNLQLGNKSVDIDYVLAPPSFLKYINNGKDEPFGAFIGDMMFINSQTHEKKPEWTKYTLLKLYSMQFINEEKDLTGRVKHWISLDKTIRFLGTQLGQTELLEYLKILDKYESSRYLEMDKEVRDFIGTDGDPLLAKRKYLEAHHNNRWVRSGRNEEFLNENDSTLSLIGFRNHSQAILSTLGDILVDEKYLVGNFVREMINIEEGTGVIISPPFNSIAYCLTKEANGVSDLVEFVTPEGMIGSQKDVIIKTKGKRTTWTALSKRISFDIHRAEQKVQQIANDEIARLSKLQDEMERRNTQFNNSLAVIKNEGIDVLKDSTRRLKTLSGDYSATLSRFSKLSSETVDNLANLEQVSKLLINEI